MASEKRLQRRQEGARGYLASVGELNGGIDVVTSIVDCMCSNEVLAVKL